MSVKASPRTPRLSIGLPVYNGGRFLLRTLNCLLTQTYDDFELIICDNASTDTTQQICRHAAKHDARVRYVRAERNLGAIANFNRTVELGRAPLFKWAAHDDCYAASYLEECMEILDRDPEVVLAHTATVFIDDAGREFMHDPASGAYSGPWFGGYQYPDSVDIGNSSRPSTRLWQVLSQSLWGTHMFGVIRRPILVRTQLLRNFVSSDRTMLAELALLGRFATSSKRLFRKRFHSDVSWSLNQREIKTKLDTSGRAYSRRARQLKAFFEIPWNKPLGVVEKLHCTGLLAAHSLKVAGHILTRKDARNEAHVRAWEHHRQHSV